ncbi:hypothetical protein Bca52824_028868 [Brassica carinata]|uniref:Uncharacterized protein n=1 Tax=Brassica carinata TaxID=52824 RepID=A0A8X7VDR1_BRACI|nr:hypothetical protein Bca52824_028868 [Brassica carinata]
MGIIKSCFSLLLGTAFGVYLAQNYDVPNIRKLTNTSLVVAKHIEENYRKPKKDDDRDRSHYALFRNSKGESVETGRGEWRARLPKLEAGSERRLIVEPHRQTSPEHRARRDGGGGESDCGEELHLEPLIVGLEVAPYRFEREKWGAKADSTVRRAGARKGEERCRMKQEGLVHSSGTRTPNPGTPRKLQFGGPVNHLRLQRRTQAGTMSKPEQNN